MKKQSKILSKLYDFAVGILFFAISLVRQVAEPKVLGKSLGLHPLLTLFATYVGFVLFGIVGMILAPVVALFAKRMLSAKIKIGSNHQSTLDNRL